MTAGPIRDDGLGADNRAATHNAESGSLPLDKKIEFHFREYESLRSEIGRLDVAKRSLQLYTLAGVTTAGGWLLANRDMISSLRMRPAWLMPLLIAIVGRYISVAYVRAAKEIGAYIAEVEKRCALPGLGWESGLAARRQKIGPIVSKTEKYAWWLVFLCALVFAAYFGLADLFDFELHKRIAP